MTDDRRSADEEFIKSLAKGLAVIESFGPDYPGMTLTTVAKRNGLSPGSARRVLVTLMRLGYIWTKDQRFYLSARTLRLGYSYLSSQPIVNLIQPRLAVLSETLNEFVRAVDPRRHRCGLHCKDDGAASRTGLYECRSALPGSRDISR